MSESMSALAYRAEQVEELKALRRQYKGSSTFEFLGPKVSEATAEKPTAFKVHFPDPEEAFSVRVEMPSTYPGESPPAFKVESETLEPAARAAIEELLDEQAGYMPGMSCISTVLMSLDDLDLSTLDLGEPGRCRSIWKVDVVNNSKQFSKAIESAAAGMPCAFYYRTIACQNNAKFSFAVDPWRAVYVVCDAPHKKAAVAYMKTIRTDGAMDMDMLGKPGKIQMTVVEEFEMAPKAKGLDGFAGTEYRTDADLAGLMDPFKAEVSAA